MPWPSPRAHRHKQCQFSVCVCGVCLVIYVTTEYLKGRRATRRVFYTIVHAWFMFEINCFSDRKCLICNTKKCSNFQHVVAGVEKIYVFSIFSSEPADHRLWGRIGFLWKVNSRKKAGKVMWYSHTHTHNWSNNQYHCLSCLKLTDEKWKWRKIRLWYQQICHVGNRHTQNTQKPQAFDIFHPARFTVKYE